MDQLAYFSNNKDVAHTKYLITQVCKKNGIIYNIQIGSVCAHIAKHYGQHITKKKNSDLIIIQKLLNKFYLVFSLKNRQQRQSCFTKIQDLINYGCFCLMSTMKAEFRDSIINISQFNVKLKQAVKRLLSSLFFEFISPEYSLILLILYLQDASEQQQKIWIQQNKIRYEDIYPYQDFFQILSSLSYHVINTRKVIDSNHYLQILRSPSSATVEWPMVIGVRSLHKLPLLKG